MEQDVDDDKDELSFNISQAAKMVGVASATIRNWEKSGLFTPQRADNGYRFFTMADVELLKKIHNRARYGGMGATPHPGDRVGRASAGEKRPMLSKSLLGKKWKMSRLKLGYSIEYVAKQTGISPSYVHKIENGQARSISFRILQTLATFYGEDILYYYESKNRPVSPLVKRGEGEPLSNNLPGVELESLERLPGGRLSIMRFTVEPGCGQLKTISHSGEEAVHIIQGTVQFVVQDELYEMRTGDSLHFNARQRHSWRNTGDETAVLFWVYTHSDNEAEQTIEKKNNAQPYRMPI